MIVVDITEFFARRGGVRRYLESKGAALERAGHAHIVIAPGAAHGDARECLAGAPASRVITVAGPSLPYDPDYHLLWRVGRVVRLLERLRPDVVEAHSPYVAAALLRWLPRRLAPVRTFFWHSPFIDLYFEPRLVRLLGRRAARHAVSPAWAWVRAFARRADAVFATSLTERTTLTAHAIPNVVPTTFGFDKDLFHPRHKDLQWRRATLGARAELPLLVAACRLAGEKRVHVVLEGFFRWRERHAGTLLIMGDGPERAALERLCAGRDDVRFLGFEADQRAVARAFASADLFVHGAPAETFGMAIAQALLCGLPAVVPNRGAAADLVDDQHGARFAADNPDAFAHALGTMFARIHAGEGPTLRAAARARGDRLPGVDEHMAGVVAQYQQHRLRAT